MATCKLFVTGIPYSWGKEQLKDTFLDFSIEPLYVDWFQKATGEFLGHAVVEVATQEDGEAAVNMINDFEVEGADGPRKLVVRIDTKAADRERGRGPAPAARREPRGDRDRPRDTPREQQRPPPEAARGPSPPSWRNGDSAAAAPWRETGRAAAAAGPPPRRDAGANNAYVEGLPPGFTWGQLKDLCRDAGFDQVKADTTPDGRGSLFSRDAGLIAALVGALDGVVVEGRTITVFADGAVPPPRPSSARGPGPTIRTGGGSGPRPRTPPRRDQDGDRDDGSTGSRKVMLSRLPSKCTWQILKDVCRDKGLSVEHTEVTSRDTGFVELTTVREARRALVMMDNTEIFGHRIRAHLEGSLPPSRREEGRGDAGRHAVPSRQEEPQGDRRPLPSRREEPPGGRGPPGDGGHRAQPSRRNERGDYGHYAPKGPPPRGDSPRRREERPPARAPPPREPAPQHRRDDGPPPRGGAESEDARRQRRLFVENLSEQADWKTLKDLFKVEGHFQVQYADVVLGSDEGACGIVEFSNRVEALEACMQFNGVLVHGQPLRLRQDRGEFEDLRDQIRGGPKRRRTA